LLLLQQTNTYCFLHKCPFLTSAGSFAQFTLTQSATQSASLEGTVQISCTISSGFHFGAFGWYQQKDGKSPSFILWRKINEDKTDFGLEFSSRFSPSNDAPKKVATLTITNVKSEDEADYYCLMWGVFWWGE
uniref:Ig-like domain-containing protein n=1 Tax=Podarcis muralis TaxID=64176 RepID=A0A670K0J7_PODMU